jgi:hypothetical protein
MAFPKAPEDSSGVPLGCVYVPDLGLRVMQGAIRTNTDGSGNETAAVALARFAGVVLYQATALNLGPGGNTVDLTVGPFSELVVDIRTTTNQGTTPTIQFFIDRKGADGQYYNIWSSSSISSAASSISTSIGAGCTVAQGFGSVVQFRWVIGGTATPGWNFTASIIGK